MTLPLYKWFQIMGMHPWHKYQLANAMIPVTSQCPDVTYEYAWQVADRAGRQDIRRSIERAEDLFFEYAHFYPSPTFRTVTLPYPRLGNQALTRYTGSDYTGHWMGFQLPDRYIKKMGYEHITTPVTPTLTWLDLDNDGLFETARAIATVPAGTLASEVYCTFVAADYVYDDVGANIITPRSVSIVGTTATILFNTPTLVRPILYTVPRPMQLDPSVLPPTAGSPFAATINVSRRYPDDTGTTLDTAQAVLIWETRPFPPWATVWTFNNATGDPAELAYAPARANIRDANQGIVYTGESVYNASTGEWSGLTGFSECRPPDRVTFRYYAGNDSQNLDIVIARLAAAELARPVCACTSANKELGEWQLDVMRLGSTNETYAQPNDATNPFGSRRGHIFAWRTVQQIQGVTGIITG